MKLSDSGKRAIDDGMDEAEWGLRVQLACAFRINAYLGWEDAINTHTSMRLPGPKHHFLLNPFGLRFDEIKASDLVKVDQEGKIVGGTTDNPLNEAGFVIHSAIHEHRYDAHCVMHTHTRTGMAMAAVDCNLEPVSMNAMSFHGRVAYHEFEGSTLLLEEREKLAGDVVQTAEHMSRTLASVQGITNRSEGDIRLQRLRGELDQSMEVAKKVEQRVDSLLTGARVQNLSGINKP